MSTIWSQDHESKSRSISAKTRYSTAWYVYSNVSLALQVSEHPPPSHFHLVSIPFQWISWKDGQARHLSNSTKVSQVSNTTGTPLDSILFHRFEAWSHRPPLTRPLLLHCQSYCVTSGCPLQSCWLSMLRQGPVDKNDRKLNHVKSDNLRGDLQHKHKAMSATKNLKPRSRVEVKVNFRQNKILLDTCIGMFL